MDSLSRFAHMFLYDSKDLSWYTLKSRSFASKIRFSCRIFRFFAYPVREAGIWSQSWVQRQDTVCCYWWLQTKLIRAPYVVVKSSGSSIWKVTIHLQSFPAKQHLHGSCIGILVRGYGRTCGKSKSPSPLTG
jgi:hypothetical protein